MHDHGSSVDARIQRVLRDTVTPHIHRASHAVAVSAWEAPGEPVPFEEAVDQPFTPLHPGSPWGRPWGTTWLRIELDAPNGDDESTLELLLDIGFTSTQAGFQAEAMLFYEDGTIIKAVEPENRQARLRAGTRVVYAEAASNPDIAQSFSFVPTQMGDLRTAPADPLYVFQGAWLIDPDEEIYALAQDFAVLADLRRVLPESARFAAIGYALDRAMNRLDPDDVAGTAPAARTELREVLSSPAEASQHRVVAVGHAHIDSAWLWPVRETQRKVARTFSNVLDLMDQYEDFVFAASSAQQFTWVRDRYPELFERVRQRVAEGRFVPVGGMWVESDTNMVGGEAMVRQMVFGKQFFIDEFGLETKEVWLPDSFGYSGALPQIVAAAGSDTFLTQKISWNDTNTMPHSSFLWEGIDGTRVFTHFPPVDLYNSDLRAEHLDRARRQNREQGHNNVSLVPYGHGDGGGGPTKEMIERARRLTDLEGSPVVHMGTPTQFFDEARAALPDPAVWLGELYLEFHRGTYTSQARTKRGNRRSEHLLREAELWAATASIRKGHPYPYQTLRKAWETVLLQQFHDILPGTSIAWVHQEAERNYAAVADELEDLIDDAVSAMAATSEPQATTFLNASPFPQRGVPALGQGEVESEREILASRDGNTVTLTSAFLRVQVNARGHIVSLVDLRSRREWIASQRAANVPRLYRDTPVQWDAWDIDAEYREQELDTIVVDSVQLEGTTVVVRGRIGNASEYTQRITIDASGHDVDIDTRVRWRESKKLLKLEFALDVHTDSALSEVQFGHVRRSTHVNTSWDAARFETPAQRWVYVEDRHEGVGIANDANYGHDVTRVPGFDGGSATVVRESLLRAPKYPDPEADLGEHVFRHSIVTSGLMSTIAAGYRLNLPLRRGTASEAEPLVRVDEPAVIVEAVKLADDESGDIVVRLYEAHGARASAVLTVDVEVADAYRTDLLERRLATQPEDPLRLELRPFEIVTVRLSPQ